MSPRQGHHLTPRSYLRKFANEQHRVNAYDRITQKRIMSVGVGQVAVVSDFYTILDAENRPSNVVEEKFLARVDDTFARIVPKLLQPNPTLTTVERVRIDILMTLQFLRTQEGKRFLENNLDFALRFAVDMHLSGASEEEVKTYIDTNYGGYSKQDQELIRRIAKDRRQRVDLSKEEWIDAIFANLSSVSDALTLRHWLFLDSEGDAFLTSDNPVVLIGREPLGLATAEMIAWPLSPTRMLLRPQTGPGDRRTMSVENASAERVRELNQIVADRAGRHIIWHPETDPLSSIDPPKGPPRVRVGSAHAGPEDRVFDVWLDERERLERMFDPIRKRIAIHEEAMRVTLDRLARRNG